MRTQLHKNNKRYIWNPSKIDHFLFHTVFLNTPQKKKKKKQKKNTKSIKLVKILVDQLYEFPRCDKCTKRALYLHQYCLSFSGSSVFWWWIKAYLSSVFQYCFEKHNNGIGQYSLILIVFTLRAIVFYYRQHWCWCKIRYHYTKYCNVVIFYLFLNFIN